MTVQQVIDLAVQGELKNLAVKTDNSSIVGFINLGLIEIYKRFPLKMEETIVVLQENVDTYVMPDDYLWLIAAYGEVDSEAGETVNVLAVNEEDNPLSINVASWNTIQVPVAIAESYVSVIYRASPTYLTINDLASNVQIPLQLLEALLHYVGYRAHNAVNGKVNAEYTTHYTLFEQSCALIVQEGMFTNDDVSMDTRISTRGFA